MDTCNSKQPFVSDESKTKNTINNKYVTINLSILSFLSPCLIKCYACASARATYSNGPTHAQLFIADVAVKAGGKTKVKRSCTSSPECSIAKANCEQTKNCEASCCSSDYCNASPGVLTVTVGVLMFRLSADLVINY